MRLKNVSSLSARLAQVTAAAGFLLVIAGGLVTSTGSGLAVPDWPLSYGTLFPPMVGGIRFEHTHRMIAATVGLLTLLLTLAVLARERRVGVRWLSIAAFGGVVLQGLLGGLTVLLQLPPAVSIAHACLGQTFFATLVVLACVLSPGWQTTRMAHPADQAPGLARWAFLSTVVLYLQLILGASLRHIGWLPKWVLAHGLVAVAALILIGRTAGGVLRKFRNVSLFRAPARAIGWLLLLQLLLGLATLFGGRPVLIATAHVATGALLLACSAALTVSLFYFAVHPAQPSDPARRPLRIYLELTKPRLTFLAVISALPGFLMASRGSPDLLRLVLLLAGTTLVGGGASALNQLLEIEPDSRMARTCGRPLPSGRITPEKALPFGVCTSAAGVWLLALGTSWLAGGLAALTLAVYLFLYTPMKQRSALCTLVGAIPGALPPLIGWAAARGTLSSEAWTLFSILFLWQLPHFLAIAWTHREDYRRAGFQMLPVLHPQGGLTFRQVVLYCLALVPVSLLPAALGQAGWFYFAVALAGGLLFLGCGLAAARARSDAWSRRLFLVSILYLPLILTALALERMIS